MVVAELLTSLQVSGELRHQLLIGTNAFSAFYVHLCVQIHLFQ